MHSSYRSRCNLGTSSNHLPTSHEKQPPHAPSYSLEARPVMTKEQIRRNSKKSNFFVLLQLVVEGARKKPFPKLEFMRSHMWNLKKHRTNQVDTLHQLYIDVHMIRHLPTTLQFLLNFEIIIPINRKNKCLLLRSLMLAHRNSLS